ncbi:Spherulation-specific family 4 [Posidoniimonas polymericola]|uniref:Spherulation-specific family 4 n=2 Tax=Posidoniimonas polymericola TaxID=2528002 RepID=A0A5C5YLA6_9BACT|nr:Spherulation-specific family 4 [Posidoniimonas polymericola]
MRELAVRLGGTIVALASLAVQHGAALEIVVPAYFYPSSGSDWSDMNAAAAQVPLTAIMNPGSGPSNAQNGDYTSAVGSLRASGGRVIGYVSSSYANRPLQDVLDDIDKYANWYDIDGIFVDEMTNNAVPANLDFYQSVYDHVKSIDPAWEVMGNPGTATVEDYLTRPAADKLMVFESFGSSYLSHTPSAWNAAYDPSRFVNLLHQLDPNNTAVMEQYVDVAVSRNVGGVYFTDDVLGNPWDRLPGFWNDMVSKVAAVNSYVRGPIQTLSNPVAVGGVTIDAGRGEWTALTAYDADADQAPLPGPELDLQAITLANDGDSLYLRMEIDETQNGAAPALGTKHNVYLDTDQDRESGFIGSGGFLSVGADYLIQGTRLYAFNGATQESFAWSFIQDLSNNQSPTADLELSLPLAALGGPGSFDWIANAANSGVEDYLPNTAASGAFGDFYRYEVGAVQVVVGDYDANGVVDAADYEYWRSHLGETGGAADGNGDGVVDAADYTVWRDAVAAQAAGASALAVPSPSSLLLMAVACTLIVTPLRRAH